MTESFAEILTIGEHRNSLGRAQEVIEIVLDDHSRLQELYDCIFNDDAWVRMRAIDSLEKVSRVHPEWFEVYIDKFLSDLTESKQPSVQWHLAQMFEELNLNKSQRESAIKWLVNLLSSKEIDWIVSANSMDALAHFTRDNYFSREELIKLLKVQQQHKSKAVVKRVNKLLSEFESVK